MMKITPLIGVILLGIIIIALVAVVGFGPEVTSQLKGQVASSSASCPAWPICLQALIPAGCTCKAPTGCGNPPPACPAGQTAQIISQTNAVPPSCQYECKPITGVASCPAGSQLLCPACAFGTPPEKCQCTCYTPTSVTTPLPTTAVAFPTTAVALPTTTVALPTTAVAFPTPVTTLPNTVAGPVIVAPQPTPAPPSGFSWLNPISWFSSSQPTVEQLPVNNTAPTTVGGQLPVFATPQITAYPAGNPLPTGIYTNNQQPTGSSGGTVVSPTPAFDADGVPIYNNALPSASVLPTVTTTTEPSALGRFWQRITQGIGNGWEAVRNWRGLRNQEN